MVTLRAVSGYANRERVYRAGECFGVDEGTAAWLEADAPGVFVRVAEREEQPDGKALDAPTENKMLKSAPADKATGRPRRKG